MARVSTITNVSGSATHAAAITLGTAFDCCRGIYVGGAGNLNVQLEDGSTTVVFVGAVAGSVLPVRATKVLSASTTASNLVALY